MFPDSVIALPHKVNAPAGLTNVTLAKVVPAEMLLLFTKRFACVKKSESPPTGAVPPQFAGVSQKSLPPPPVQVAFAAFSGVAITNSTQVSNHKYMDAERPCAGV